MEDMGGQEYGFSPFLFLENIFDKDFLHNGIKPGSRLIQDQDFRISIHTLLAESDSKISQMFHITHRNFAHLSHILYIYFLF